MIVYIILDYTRSIRIMIVYEILNSINAIMMEWIFNFCIFFFYITYIYVI